MAYNEGIQPEVWVQETDFKTQPPLEDTWDAQNQDSDCLRLELHRQATQLFNVSEKDVPFPYAAVFISWDQNSIFGGGVNFWNTHVDSDEVYDKIIKPTDRDMFIIGDCYSKEQGWVEGAIDTADMMMERYF